jgi:hypothetical protein
MTFVLQQGHGRRALHPSSAQPDPVVVASNALVSMAASQFKQRRIP